MRTKFPLYYHLTETEKKELFASPNCYFVFDTNALLDIYRLGKDTADKVLRQLDKYKERIVIPKHVACEYHNNMLDTITDLGAKYDNFSRQNNKETLLDKILSFMEVKNFPSVKRKVTIHLRPAIDSLFNDIEIEQKYMMDQFRTWDLQNKLSEALGSLVLNGFSEEEIKAIEDEGKERYAKSIPPGYMDSKEKDSNIYGDLIIWKEILEFAKLKDCSIIFIGRDMKEDWMQKLHGFTCGPRQELLEEFNRYSPNGKFHIYTLDQFLDYANVENKVLDDEELTEVKELKELMNLEKYEEVKSKSSVPVKMDYTNADKSGEKIVEEKSLKGVEKSKSV